MEVQSESKWKQLGELAMSTGKVFCFFLICKIFFSASTLCLSFFILLASILVS